MEEVWRDIYFEEDGIIWDYRGLYQISNIDGRVKSLNYRQTGKEKILKPQKNKNGYEIVGLWKNGKRKNFLIHRLAAHLFIENDDPEHKTDVNHKDENKTNNSVENLEWCTKEYNNNYGTRNERAGKASKGRFVGENHPMYGIHRYGKDAPNLGSLIERWSKDGILIDIKYRFEYVEMGFTGSNISNCCKGKRKTAGGYIFKYYEEKD